MLHHDALQELSLGFSIEENHGLRIFNNQQNLKRAQDLRDMQNLLHVKKKKLLKMNHCLSFCIKVSILLSFSYTSCSSFLIFSSNI